MFPNPTAEANVAAKTPKEDEKPSRFTREDIEYTPLLIDHCKSSKKLKKFAIIASDVSLMI
jgi:hypothetical protein